MLAGSGVLSAPTVIASTGGRVRVGAILPLSGNLSRFGQQARLGLELARNEINAAGGLQGRTLELVYSDDIADPAKAEDAARSLTAQRDIIAVAGPITSASRNAISHTMVSSGTPLLYATDYEGGDCGDTLFYFNSVPNQVTTPLVNYLLETTEGSVFMLGADYVWPARMFDSCTKIVSDRGRKIAGRRFIPLNGLSDYGPVIDQVRSSGAKILLLALPGTPHTSFVAAANQAGLFPSVTLGLLGTVALYSHAERAAKSIRAVSCVPFVETDPSADARAFVDKARRSAGADAVVSAYAVTHYNALMALKAGLERSRSVSRDAAIQGMSGLDYETPTGTLFLDAKTRHTTLRMYLTEVGNQGLRVLRPPTVIKPDAACIAGA